MKPISLDYISPKPHRRQASGIAVLFLSLLFAGYLAHDYAGLSDGLEATQAKLEHVRHRSIDLSTPMPAITPTLRTEVDEASRVIRQLGLSWNDLFDVIESIPHEHVAVLSIQPDAEGGSVTISAEAKEAADIVVYIDAISESGILKDAHLISHQIKTQDPQKPVGFSIIAAWAGVIKSGRYASDDGATLAQQ